MYILLPLYIGPRLIAKSRPLAILRVDASDAWDAVDRGARQAAAHRRRDPASAPSTPRLGGRFVLWPDSSDVLHEPWHREAEKRLWGETPEPVMVSPPHLPHLREADIEVAQYFSDGGYTFTGFTKERSSLHTVGLGLEFLHRVCVLESSPLLHESIMRRVLPRFPEAVIDWARGFPLPIGYEGPCPELPALGAKDLMPLAQSDDPEIRLRAMQLLTHVGGEGHTDAQAPPAPSLSESRNRGARKL